MELAGNNIASNNDDILARLKQLFGDASVIPEWDVAKNSQDAFGRELYCPRVDFAVGPFNTDANIIHNNNQIDQALQRYSRFLERLRLQSDSRDKMLTPNGNPRCFLVIEVEDKNTAKHRMGSIMNASALGKIGIIVGSNEKTYKSLVRIRKYLEFLERVNKTESVFKNVIIIVKEDFLRSLIENLPART